MATWYRTGTVNVTQGSPTVTATDTTSDFAGNALVGDAFYCGDGKPYEIMNIIQPTNGAPQSITLFEKYGGATQTAQPYKIVPTRANNRYLAERINAIIGAMGHILASIVEYDDTQTGLIANNVQTAIQQLKILAEQLASDTQDGRLSAALYTKLNGIPNNLPSASTTVRGLVTKAVDNDATTLAGTETLEYTSPSAVAAMLRQFGYFGAARLSNADTDTYDSKITGGVFLMTSTDSTTGSPFNTSGYLLVIGYGSQQCVQLAFHIEDPRLTTLRIMRRNVFSPWTPFFS